MQSLNTYMTAKAAWTSSVLSQVHCKSIYFYHQAKEAADPPQKQDPLPSHVKLRRWCCCEAPFPFSSMQPIIGTIASPEGQTSLGLIHKQQP